jgi:hypothetical protein
LLLPQAPTPIATVSAISAALLLVFMTDRLPHLDMAALDQRQEMTDVPGMMSGGQVPMSRLQVKRSTQWLSVALPKPATHDPAFIGTRQRRAVPPPSVSTNTTYSQTSPSIAQTRAC